MKYMAFLSFEHITGKTLLNEYWLDEGQVVSQRTIDYGTGELADWKRTGH